MSISIIGYIYCLSGVSILALSAILKPRHVLSGATSFHRIAIRLSLGKLASEALFIICCHLLALSFSELIIVNEADDHNACCGLIQLSEESEAVNDVSFLLQINAGCLVMPWTVSVLSNHNLCRLCTQSREISMKIVLMEMLSWKKTNSSHALFCSISLCRNM